MSLNTTRVASAALAAVMVVGTGLAQAQEAGIYTKEVDGSFADVAFAVEQAITNEGLVIDSVNHVGEMLARTREDVGGAKELYVEADTFNFCSAILSRQAMEADIANIQYCPYGIFVYEAVAAPGKVVVGHRLHAPESMKGVDELLTRIVDTATE